MVQLGGRAMRPPPSEIFSFLGAPTDIEVPRVNGPRKVAPNKGPYKKGPLQIKGPYTDKGPPVPHGQGAHTYIHIGPYIDK